MTIKRTNSKPGKTKPGKGKAEGTKTTNTKSQPKSAKTKSTESESGEANAGPAKEGQESDTDGMAGEELEELVLRARSGDKKALPRLRQYLDKYPTLWFRKGHLALQAQEAWIDRMAGKDLHARECLRLQVNHLKRNLAGESTDPLLCLQAEEVITTWLRHYCHDAQDALASPNSPEWAKFRRKRMRISADRFDKAIQGMAKLRKLLPPSLPDSAGYPTDLREEEAMPPELKRPSAQERTPPAAKPGPSHRSLADPNDVFSPSHVAVFALADLYPDIDKWV